MNNKLIIRTLFIVVFSALPAMVMAQQRSISLEEVFSLAEEHSRSLAVGRQGVEVAKQRIEEAKSGRLPDLDISLSASYLGNGTLTDRDFSNSMGIRMPHLGNNVAIEAAQLIYGGGVVDNSIALAHLEHEMANINLADSHTRVNLMLSGFYFELCKLYNILDIFDQNIALQEELIAETEARIREGVVLPNDITRQELRLEQLKLQRREVENSAKILSSRLATTIGLDSDTELLPDTSIASATQPQHDEPYWQQLAAESAHALQRGEVAIAMSERAEKIARAERLPKVAVVAANHFDGPITIEVPVINKNFNYWYVGVGVSFNIASLYKSNRTIARHAMATEQSRLQLDELREQTMLDIRADYIRYNEAIAAVETYIKSLELAKSNYDIIEKRYKNDMALYTEMRDAADQLLEAEMHLANAQINVTLRYYKLLATAGAL